MPEHSTRLSARVQPGISAFFHIDFGAPLRQRPRAASRLAKRVSATQCGEVSPPRQTTVARNLPMRAHDGGDDFAAAFRFFEEHQHALPRLMSAEEFSTRQRAADARRTEAVGGLLATVYARLRRRGFWRPKR